MTRRDRNRLTFFVAEMTSFIKDTEAQTLACKCIMDKAAEVRNSGASIREVEKFIRIEAVKHG